MNNHMLEIEMYSALHSAKSKIYYEFIKRCLAGDGNEEKYTVLTHILNEVPIPDQVFYWLPESGRNICEISKLLIDKKMELDAFIENIVTACKKGGHSSINLLEFYNIIEKIDPSVRVSYVIYLYELLIDGNFYPYMYHAHEAVYPLKNILDNYKNISYLIDQALINAAYYARWATLQCLWASQEGKGLHWRFQPSVNPQHANVLKWIEDNIRKGEEDVEATLGWSCGPDSGPWPSTHLFDYQNTRRVLYDIMK